VDLSSFVNVRGAGVISFLEETLPLYGLNERETFEFISFWGPRMAKHELMFVSFSTSGYARERPLRIDPAPDSLIRLSMVWRPIGAPIAAREPVVKTPSRMGFTVVEWGGMEVSE
jgi:hypothetical protein